MLLGFLQIIQQRSHRIGHQRLGIISQGFPPVAAELPGHGGFHQGILIAGFLPQFHQRAGMLLDVGCHILEIQHGRANEDFAGHVAAKLGDDGSADFLGIQFGSPGFTGGDIRKADSRPPATTAPFAINAAEIVVFVLCQHAAFNDRTGCHHTDDVPLDQSLGQRRVLHLLTDGHFIALGNQPGHISFVGVIRHPAHGCPLFLAAVFAGQCQFQLPRCGEGIIIEHLIKIPHAIEEDLVGMLLFDLKILLHHGRYCLFGHVSHSCFFTA